MSILLAAWPKRGFGLGVGTRSGAAPSNVLNPSKTLNRQLRARAEGAPRERMQMNARDDIRFRRDTQSLPDIQSRVDTRGLHIHAVGIKDVRYPVTIRSEGKDLQTIAVLSMTVGLPAVSKGTHMSRFIELLEGQTEALDQAGFKTMVLNMLNRLDAKSGAIEMNFPYFARKTAPVSGVQSLLDYDVCWRGTVADAGRYLFSMRVKVPATSLCPCSKEISAYGAHNQRSHISIEAELTDEVAIDELIAIAERSASCEVYGLLKRVDEKYVTERAYDNPKFVEDLVRDVALALQRDPRVDGYIVEAENFESIHNHSAFARIVRPGLAETANAVAGRVGSAILVDSSGVHGTIGASESGAWASRAS